ERIDRQVKALQDGLRTMAGPLREQLLEERLRPVAESARAALRQAADTPKAKRTPEQAALLKRHPEADVGDDDLARRFPEYGAVREQIRRAVAAREKERPPPLDRLSVLVETDANPAAHHVLRRGQHNAPGPEVGPGVPAALT